MDNTFLIRFRKICGMLGSDSDGERSNAARLATEMLKTNNLTWNDIEFASIKNKYPKYEQPKYEPPKYETNGRLVKIPGILLGESDLAWKVRVRGIVYWFPKSVCDCHVDYRESVNMIVPTQLAKKKGLI